MEMGVIPAGEAEVDCLSNLGERCSGPAIITAQALARISRRVRRRG
jgi:hypothetical protein